MNNARERYKAGGVLYNDNRANNPWIRPAERSEYATNFYRRFNAMGGDLYWGTVTTKTTTSAASTKGSVSARRMDSGKILVFGDSHINGGLGADIKANLEAANPKYKVYVDGVDGAGFSNQFITHADKVALKNQIESVKPDQLFCFLGTNEAPNKLSIDRLAAKMEAFFTDFPVQYKNKVVIITLPYYANDAETFTTADSALIARGLLSYALNNKLGFIDIYKPEFSAQISPTSSLQGVHFTSDGYKQIADWITQIYLGK
jgi:lysophospholipase L1-like esterase